MAIVGLANMILRLLHEVLFSHGYLRITRRVNYPISQFAKIVEIVQVVETVEVVEVVEIVEVVEVVKILKVLRLAPSSKVIRQLGN
jgi:hypothetical protein